MHIAKIPHILFWLVVAYLVTHVLFLTKLPIFADEAIYIRWAQVGYRDPAEYAFLPMLDGKPPLHVWAMIPFLLTFGDPLFAGRFLSVLAGLGLIFVMRELAKDWGADEEHVLLAAALSGFLPWWFFYGRMALAEMLITLSFAFGIMSATKLIKTHAWKHAIGIALGVGVSLWIKTSAVFFIPVFALLPFAYEYAVRSKKLNIASLVETYKKKAIFILVTAGIVGVASFLLLKLHPLFPSLFGRSKDYSFTLQEILSGQWKYILTHTLPHVSMWLIWYATPLCAFSIFFLPKKGKVFFLLGLVVSLPFIILGKVLYPRYLLPAMVPFTLAMVFGFQEMKKSATDLRKFLLQGTLLCSAVFIGMLLFKPDSAPFLSADKEQYIQTWAAGYGTKESWEFLRSRAIEKNQKILVVTEGFFGSLPDGLQVYADRTNTNSLVEIHGIGQPIQNIPEWVMEKSKTQEVYLMVNKDRFLFNDESKFKIVQEYPRPMGEPLYLVKIGYNVRDEK